jgi:hypothetical protein
VLHEVVVEVEVVAIKLFEFILHGSCNACRILAGACVGRILVDLCKCGLGTLASSAVVVWFELL